MHQQIIKVIISIILFFTVSSESYALSKLGHQMVCQLAYDGLASDKQTKIDHLLESLTNHQKKAIQRYNKVPKSTDVNFALACTWADAIKKQKRFDKYKSWHYLNVTRSTSNITNTSCDSNCLPQAVLHHQDQLQSSSQQQEKLKALMFLGHWLGDIHQPLHISYASDLGGNKTPINISEIKCNNLHWYWDDCLLHYQNPSYQQLLIELKQIWLSTPSQEWQPALVWLWANESYQITRSADLGYCQITKGTCIPTKDGPITLNDSYPKKFNPILKQQIVLAAKRLSAVLNASL